MAWSSIRDNRSDRKARLNRIENLLFQTRHGFSISELAKRLEIGERTVRRDLAALQDEGANCIIGYCHRAARQPHHNKAVESRGTNYLGNCAILCINHENCQLYVGHGGHCQKRVVLFDNDLPFLMS